jgi:hypothetical protein
MNAVSKSAAITQAAKTVSIWGRGTSWTVCGPYRYEKPSGPCTESQCDSREKAMRRAAAWKACVALSLMGKLTEDAHYAVDYAANGGFDQIGNTRQLVGIGLKAAR